jgi:predicted O-methyltransferase YrrM
MGAAVLAAVTSAISAQAPGGDRAEATLEASPVPKDDNEERIYKLFQEIDRKQGRLLNVPEADGRLLRLLTETIGAKKAVEIGTSNGISSIWIGLALQKTGGKLITHELDPQRAAMARENFKAAGMADIITVVEGNAHETVAQLQGPVDLAFIDADKEGYADYLKKLLPLVRPGGLVLAHNINSRTPNPEFLKAVTTNPELETVFYTRGAGMSVTLKKR